jgi:hypothetical protein
VPVNFSERDTGGEEKAGGGVAALGVKQERAAQCKGRMTWYVGMTCLVACVGGAIFGYDIGISGTHPFPGILCLLCLCCFSLCFSFLCRGTSRGDPDPDVALGDICCSSSSASALASAIRWLR